MSEQATSPKSQGGKDQHDQRGANGIVYKGVRQIGSTIQQKLDGPIGDGMVSGEIVHYEVVDYNLDEKSQEGCTTLRVTLKEGDKELEVS